jgi:membrane-bound lytic murein transglycosylase D
VPSPPPERPNDLSALDHIRIDAWEDRLRTDPQLRQDTRESLARGQRYLPGLRRILAENGVPPSLALLPAIESGFYPTARGRRGERGLWQLRRSTARRFGLVVNAHRDDRLQPERATRAAARFLRALHQRYGDWALALAAYNAGERRVDRALARDPEATFWALAEQGWLPHVSRDYVPRFFALLRVAGEQEPTAVGSAL